MIKISKGVWQRRGPDQISKPLMTILVGILFVWTVGLVSIGAFTSYSWEYSKLYVLGELLVAIIGIYIYLKSNTPLISFIGVSILSIFLGLIIGPALAFFSFDIVIKAFLATAILTFAVSVLGIEFPEKLQGIGNYLAGVLMFLVVANFIRAFLLPQWGIPPNSLWILDWISLILFTLYIWYDLGRAMKIPRTLDNAVDASGDLILDVVNIFLDILNILGGKKSSK